MVAMGPDRLDDPLHQSARLRVRGISWVGIGRELERDAEELERATLADERAWRKMVKEAERDIFRETGWESLNILRFLMRSKEEKTRLKAVDIYMRFWSGLHRHRPMNQRKTGGPYEVFDDVEMNDANLLSLLADAFPHLELREKPPPDEPDP